MGLQSFKYSTVDNAIAVQFPRLEAFLKANKKLLSFQDLVLSKQCTFKSLLLLIIRTLLSFLIILSKSLRQKVKFKFGSKCIIIST